MNINYDMRRQLIINTLNNGCSTIKSVAFRLRCNSRDLHNDFAVLLEQAKIYKSGFKGREICYSTVGDKNERKFS